MNEGAYLFTQSTLELEVMNWRAFTRKYLIPESYYKFFGVRKLVIKVYFRWLMVPPDGSSGSRSEVRERGEGWGGGQETDEKIPETGMVREGGGSPIARMLLLYGPMVIHG